MVQRSGLPLELKVKFQINMAMRDVSNMAHVEKFSNIVIPMLWFEIVSKFIFVFCMTDYVGVCIEIKKTVDYFGII